MDPEWGQNLKAGCLVDIMKLKFQGIMTQQYCLFLFSLEHNQQISSFQTFLCGHIFITTQPDQLTKSFKFTLFTNSH